MDLAYAKEFGRRRIARQGAGFAPLLMSGETMVGPEGHRVGPFEEGGHGPSAETLRLLQGLETTKPGSTNRTGLLPETTYELVKIPGTRPSATT